MSNASETRTLRVCVDIADTVADADREVGAERATAILASYCSELDGVAGAGVVLAQAGGSLHVAAASDDGTRALEHHTVERAQGPAVDAFRSGSIVAAVLTDRTFARWPELAPLVAGAGFASVTAIALRRGDVVVGALTLYGRLPQPLPEPAQTVARALADLTTIAVLGRRALTGARTLAAQLDAALTSRVVIEQAKGALAQRLEIDVDRAFAHLRDYARSHNRRLDAVARDVVDGVVRAGAFREPPPGR